jgi:hypothetical protein
VTGPIFPPVDPATGALPAATEARYAKPADLTPLASKSAAALTNPTVTHSPALTAGDNSTKAANTAQVQAAIAAYLAPLLSHIYYVVDPVAGVYPDVSAPIALGFRIEYSEGGPRPTSIRPQDRWYGSA